MKAFENCACICHRMPGVKHDQTYKQRDEQPSFSMPEEVQVSLEDYNRVKESLVDVEKLSLQEIKDKYGYLLTEEDHKKLGDE